LAQYLDTLLLEFKDNAESFAYYAKLFQKSARYANYINSHDEKSINVDSIAYYQISDNDGLGFAFAESMAAKFPTNAFEMFKISGVMRQTKDKELLQAIWSTYTQIEDAKFNIDRIMQIKEREILKFEDLIADGKKIDVPMKTFHMYHYPHELVRHCRLASKEIKKMLLKFE
jgi:hypothetical protein